MTLLNYHINTAIGRFRNSLIDRTESIDEIHYKINGFMFQIRYIENDITRSIITKLYELHPK